MRMNKMLSIITATTLVTGFVVSLTASAIVNPIVPGKDPNGDGRLTLADSTFIQTVLAGRYNPADLTELDVDNNGVVSMADSKYVIMDYAGAFDDPMNLENPVSPASLTPDIITPTSNAPTSTRNYRKYNAQTGAYLRSYPLTIDNVDNISATPSGVIGTDDRVRNRENKGAVKIISDGEPSSGFVVAPHVIATAAHVVYNRSTSTPAIINGIKAFNNDNELVNFTAVEYHIPEEFYTTGSNAYDYALITVSQDLSDYMTFDLGLITDFADDKNVAITVAGYPAEVNGQPVNNATDKNECFVSNGVITIVNDTNFRYTADTTGGNSGSVVYCTEFVNNVEYRTAVGVHFSMGTYFTNNIGLRFTPEIIKFYKINTNISY